MESVISQQFRLHDKIEDRDRRLIDQARIELFTEMNEGYPIYLSSETDNDLVNIKNIANRIRNDFSNLVIIATGASNTIPYSITSLNSNKKLNIYYLDNADQNTLNNVLNKLSPENTAFLAISKSGETIEILALTLLIIRWLGDSNLATHLFAITDPGESSLRKIATSYKATVIDHPKSIGGRYAVFSSVGLLIAAVVGFNIDRIINYAKESFLNLIKENSWVCEGASYILSMSALYANSVFIICGEQFSGINSWYRQLVAESLGKKLHGINPLAASLTDQHSQLQLYLDGPNDKFFTFLSTSNYPNVKISNKINITNLEYLEGKSLNEIVKAQLITIQDLLFQHKKNIRIINTNNVQEEFIAEFMMGQMLEIILIAFARNINPFDQPAVELIKHKIRAIL
jgi:glucose-6-phosphate isomerase